MEEKQKTSNIDDEEKIDINDQVQVQRWCREFQCNEMRLKNAVRAVGLSVDAIRKYMAKNF